METKIIIIIERHHSWHVLIKLQLQQNTSLYNYVSTFKENPQKPLKILGMQLQFIKLPKKDEKEILVDNGDKWQST